MPLATILLLGGDRLFREIATGLAITQKEETRAVKGEAAFCPPRPGFLYLVVNIRAFFDELLRFLVHTFQQRFLFV